MAVVGRLPARHCSWLFGVGAMARDTLSRRRVNTKQHYIDVIPYEYVTAAHSHASVNSEKNATPLFASEIRCSRGYCCRNVTTCVIIYCCRLSRLLAVT